MAESEKTEDGRWWLWRSDGGGFYATRTKCLTTDLRRMGLRQTLDADSAERRDELLKRQDVMEASLFGWLSGSGASDAGMTLSTGDEFL
ncbi:hypothetical protein AB0O34_34740 [Sphaerisporangium sp. NPDC088356]|uniref:hypothetical protein n=1 Tax=Sphaerisporangium sp. NPDC088356 TaxID=3154871 RepID=UPI003437CDF3